jgi:hypothetical protein
MALIFSESIISRSFICGTNFPCIDLFIYENYQLSVIFVWITCITLLTILMINLLSKYYRVKVHFWYNVPCIDPFNIEYIQVNVTVDWVTRKKKT